MVRWPLQPLQPLQKTQLQPPVGPSVDSLCHPWFTTTNSSFRFLFLKLPPPPCACAVLLVLNYIILYYTIQIYTMHACMHVCMIMYPEKLQCDGIRVNLLIAKCWWPIQDLFAQATLATSLVSSFQPLALRSESGCVNPSFNSIAWRVSWHEWKRICKDL